MGRSPRITQPGLAYHVLNRRAMGLPLFRENDDYLGFEQVLAESLERPEAPGLLAWCLMPNHWHLVVQAGRRTDLSTWMQWLTVTHTHRWHAHTQTVGEGAVYQGRFKSFPVQKGAHFLTVCGYVEANAWRAKLVKRAEAWRWSSLWVRRRRSSALNRRLRPWPVDRPRNWLAGVNRAMGEEALRCVRQSVTRGVPLGDETWKARVANRLGLDSTLRPRGRPRKDKQESS
ncbi:MAG: transposase [Phycisphaerae bacterium]